MHVPADEWQRKIEASVKEVKKLEDNYIVKCQNLGVCINCHLFIDNKIAKVE